MLACPERACQCPPGICRVQAQPGRWLVRWRSPEPRESYFADRALAEAYAAAHHGELVPLVMLSAGAGSGVIGSPTDPAKA
ncbi:MAG: hypothetical protein RL375_251 [Pseudomonadota bacterium]|jgi:hypothetical protein